MNKEEKERILKCVMNQIERERIPRGKRRLKQAASLVLAGVTIFACGAFTVKALDLDDKLAARLGASSGEITEAVTDLNAAVEKNGLRIEAKQAVGDGRRVYAVFVVTSLTDQKLDETCGFKDSKTIMTGRLPEDEIPDTDRAQASRIGELICSSTDFDFCNSELSEDGKSLRFDAEFIMDKPIYDRKVVIRFQDFGKVINIPEEEEEVLFQGDWILEFPLKYKKVSQTYTADISIPLKSGALRLEHLELSPISWFMRFSVKDYSETLEYEWDSRSSPKFKLKDGSFADTYTDTASWLDDGANSVGTIEGAFAKAIDFRQVESIVFGGIEIPLRDLQVPAEDEKQ